MADSLKHRVYAAESWIVGGQCWTSTRDAAAFIRAMERDVRFVARYPDHKPVRVFRLKERGAPAAYYASATHGVYLPYWAQTAKSIVHEMGHAVTPGDPGHGARFCREYHWLVRTFMSERQANELEQGFLVNGIKALAYDDDGRRVKDLEKTST